MKLTDYPDLIRELPEADLPIEKVVGRLFQGEHGQICFFEFEPPNDVPPHSHARQWGIVIDGEMWLTIDGETKLMQKGDSYFIPAGVMHSARFEKPCKVLDFFEDVDRYRPRGS